MFPVFAHFIHTHLSSLPLILLSLPPLSFAQSVSGAPLLASFSASLPPPPPPPCYGCFAQQRWRERKGGEELPLLVKQQLGNSSGSNKDSTTLLWLMPARTPTRLLQAYLVCPYMSLDSVTRRAAKHTKPVVHRQDHTNTPKEENTPLQQKMPCETCSHHKLDWELHIQWLQGSVSGTLGWN